MQHFIGTHGAPAANDADISTCLEAHGLLSQSYDSLDHLMRELAAQPAQAQSTDHAPGVEVTLVGHHEWLPFSHMFL